MEKLWGRVRECFSAHKRYALGVVCLLGVVCIWVGSSNLMQFIFQDNHYAKPFFITYFSTSLFTVYLSGFIFCRPWREQEFDGPFEWATERKPKESNETKAEQEDAQNLIESNTTDGAEGTDATDSETKDKDTGPPPQMLPLLEVAKLALIFCPIWFLANFTFNWSLSLTSVSSNTVISTSSSFFALVFAHIGGVDKITIKKLGAVLLTCGGVALVSFTDKAEGEHGFWGDMLALVGAVCYGLYTALMSIKIKDERQVSMPQFFGLVGLFNMLLLWPLFLVLHFTGLETFEIPTLQVVLYQLANGLIGTVLSDLLWSFSIFLTSPLVATLGLSLNAPLAMVIDLIRQKKLFQVSFLFGCGLVLAGFLIANITCAWEEAWERRTLAKLTEKCKRGSTRAAEAAPLADQKEAVI